MNEKEFLRLLSGIDPELIADAAPKCEKLHEDAENDENTEVLSYDMREVRIVDMDAKAKKRRKIIIPALIAAVLMTGGVTAAVVASHGKIVIENSKSESSQGSESSSDSESSAPKLPDNAEPVNTLGLNLTDQQDQPAAQNDANMQDRGGLGYPTETATGWYHNDYTEKTVKKYGHPVTQYDKVLSYTDAASGETVPLCAKPECTHDGNLYCTATTKAYRDISGVKSPDNAFVFHDGYLYRLATKNMYNETGTKTTGDPHTVLLRYEPDGTGITELHDFGEGGCYIMPVLHRGYIWCCTASSSKYEEQNNSQLYSWGFGIYGYELATGKVVTLAERKTAKPEMLGLNEMPRMMFGFGDYLYVKCDTWIADGFNNGISRISLLNGKCESVQQQADVIWTDGKDMICYGFHDKFKDEKGYHLNYHHINLETGEKEEVSNVFDNEHDENHWTYDEVKLKRYSYMTEEAVLYDGHLFAVTEEDKGSLEIYDMNFTRLHKIRMNLDDFWLTGFPNVQNGRLYLQGFSDGGTSWVYCEVSELMEKGADAVWHKAYTVRQNK